MKINLIKLTDYNTINDIWVNLSHIESLEYSDYTSCTFITMVSGTKHAVRNNIEEIDSLIAKLNE